MRRYLIALCSILLLGVVNPSPAHAWWDYLEQFSGPGPWRGFDFDARLVCWVQNKQGNDTLKMRSVVPGVIVSACRLGKDERRRASIDLGMRFLWTHDGDFARGERISFTTLEPAFTWSPIKPGKYDWIDYGIGAGVYWISSKEFPSFNGAFLEPVRLELHAPSACDPWWCGLLLVRGSLLVFPAGFEPNAFAPRPGARERISRDWVPSIAVFVDLERMFPN